MKILILLIALLCFSCTHSQKNNEQSKEETITTNIDTVEVTDSLIVGLWGIYVHEINGTQMLCNACPNIEFAKNGIGKFTNTAEEDFNFTYTLLSDNVIQFSFNTTEPYFDETEYFYKRYTENDLETLKLSSKEGKVNYILRK